ncbi:MAG TPA: DNA repair protein RadC [Thermoanaerobaculia bacterium]|nr:DNA repair protein RadC [Thermoanaerobaculia bacterium]
MSNLADWPEDDRPRQRMARFGVSALSDDEIVALLIAPGHTGWSSLDIARDLLSGGLQTLARTEWVPGIRVGQLGPSRVARVGAALELGRRVAAVSSPGSVPLYEPSWLAARLVARYADQPRETFGGVFLDSRNHVVSERVISHGTSNSAPATPRDVIRFAMQENAASVVLFHNHPSGNISPSPDDIAMTRRTMDAGKPLDVEILDHLIITRHGVTSMKRAGHI